MTIGAIAVALFCLRVLGDQWSSHFPPQFPDAFNPGRNDTYYAVSRLTPFRPSFYWAPRPIVYPAFVWLLGRSSQLIVLAQTLVYCGAVAYLCATAWQAIKTRAVAVAAIVLLVLIAIETRFALWTTQVLSESLGISLGLVAIAAWWRVCAEPTPRRVTWAWVWTIAWLLERDAHTLPVAVVVVPVAVATAVLVRGMAPELRRRLLAGALIALVGCGYVYVAQKVSGRNRYPLENNIGIRVLPDPSLRAWFAAGGMPLDSALANEQGKSAFDDNRYFDTSPTLARFRSWAEGPGSRRFLESMVVRAPDWYRMLDKQWPALLAANYPEYDGYGVHNRLPERPPLQLGGPSTPGGLRAWVLVSVGVLALALGFGPRPRIVVFAAGGLLVVAVDLYGSFVGDALEAGRHIVGPLDRLAVMFVVAVAIGVDGLWQAWRTRTNSTTPAAMAHG
ncbi:MAG TPA: hypothetical protein VNY84_00565 [Acidimicrobiales bacterium]|nr:hypothetical protein [Acidimicrobiales bacterium]